MTTPDHDCRGCPLAERREFLREALWLVAGVFASVGAGPVPAATLGFRFGSSLADADEEHTYPIPIVDGAVIDKENQIILVRFEGKVFAFNLSCPHQNTALRWYPDDRQFQCPKHHSRYTPAGVFISGRATRNMDRLGIRRDGGNVIVDVSQFYRQDKNPAEWEAAFITI